MIDNNHVVSNIAVSTILNQQREKRRNIETKAIGKLTEIHVHLKL